MIQPTIRDIERARERIYSIARRTPLERSRWLSKEMGREVMLKLECFQATGSFKIRGAMAKLSFLTEEERASGVLTVSAGNHGLAVAHCAEAMAIDATIVAPESASRAKVEGLRRYHVTLIERGTNYDEAERAAREMERESGKTFVSPYNDALVIAGQGTAALEILEDAPAVEAIIAPCGGGGLLAGVAIAAKAINPHIKVYGAEPEASPTMTRAIEAGRIIEIEEDETIADGLAGNIEPGSITFPIIEQVVDDIVLVSEEAIRDAMARVAREDHLIVEGSAAVAIAALADPKIEGRKVAAIVTGRNISLDLFKDVILNR
ncbi:MAG TPA: threonine/serine dehydratase [Blastocatellia bacterium]|nr:threonine/serine dehydratase [Blastocatellia bacterium]